MSPLKQHFFSTFVNFLLHATKTALARWGINAGDCLHCLVESPVGHLWIRVVLLQLVDAQSDGDLGSLEDGEQLFHELFLCIFFSFFS